VIAQDIDGLGVLVVTSPDRLQQEWQNSRRSRLCDRSPSHVETLLDPLASDAGLVTVLDGHPSTLSWIAAVKGHRIVPLGVDRFGQSGDIIDLYRTYGIDCDAIVEAAARLCRPHS
jgi:pyruvate dehydrogenase E1 component